MSSADDDKDTSVRVAVRIRPQISRELIDLCRICTTVTPDEPQVVLGADKAFTFDYVFDTGSNQVEIYSKCVENLIEGSLKGYNATVLAYGQTGSGKTYTMGTGFDRDIDEGFEGIIPRAVRHLFSGIESCQNNYCNENGGLGLNTIQFTVAVQFLELYNEELIDLLDPYNKGKVYKIHEDPCGGIMVTGTTIKPITGPQDALRILQQGALARTTASTQMNVQSSRSHALFTILIKRQRVMSAEESGLPEGDLETITSKFHFVDLAGSERLKRTGATGERAREGISINCGLLALGNVISALGDKSKKASHVPYRDSKLTRLLQDSLGGNSQTVMIACISPTDRDFMETLNTLKYANRARNIKNRVLINQDQSSRQISQLRREIAALQLELLEYKQGKRSIDADGNTAISDTFHENAMLLDDNKRLQQRLKAMQETINSLTDRNSGLASEKALAGWNFADSDKSVSDLIAGYMNEIEKLKAKLIESEQMYQQLKKSMSSPRSNVIQPNMSFSDFITNGTDQILNYAKKSVERERELLMSKSLPGLEENQGENDSDSESDTESDDKTGEMEAELIDLNSDIELKTKLIEQLELSHQRMEVMRHHYEEKLNVLNTKIIYTQNERDKVLKNMSGSSLSSQPANQNEKVKKVRDEYERKLNDMQKEMRKLESAQKEHIRQQRALQAQETQLRSLRTELSDLKSIKIRLMRKISDENSRHKDVEAKKIREIAQLRKEQRKQLNQIKSLQAKGNAKDQVLKRKTEEITALRKGQRNNLSMKASGRVASKSGIDSKPLLYSPRQAKLKWNTLSRTIGRAARSKQAVVELERELERLLEEREILSRELSTIQKRQQISYSAELASEEDTINANLNYIQENIEQVQHSIMELEEGKESAAGTVELQTIFENIKTVDEAKFLLEKLCGAAITQQCETALTSSRLVEHEAMLKEVQQDSNIQKQLLAHVLTHSPVAGAINDIGGNLDALTSNNLNTSTTSIGSGRTVIVPFEHSILSQNTVHNDNERENRLSVNESSDSSRSPSPSLSNAYDSDMTNSSNKTSKVRRRTALPQELLFGDQTGSNGNIDESMTRSFTQPPVEGGRSFIPLSRVPSAPGSLKGIQPIPATRQRSDLTASPKLARKSFESPNNVLASPRIPRRTFSTKASPGLDDNESMAGSTPLSPSAFRRMTSREENVDVFARLGAGTQDPAPGGSIREHFGRPKLGSPLHCTHVVDGHNNSVLSIKVYKNTLYTSAADRTVKVWDLNRYTAVQCLSSHPGPVIGVEHDPKMNLLYSASGAFVRIWDIRSSNIKPIKTLCSSGNTLSGTSILSAIQPGESPITALSLGASGNLYTAASDKVRYWDIRTFSCLGKLSGGHQAAVMCVTAWEGPNNTDFVATGSKDHYVKVFEVPLSGGMVNPLLHLEPPHYDGVQALIVDKNAVGVDAELFSGSRDSGIKRWDLRNGELIQSLNNAHKGWVSGMAISGDVLLSCCRGGIIRFWNVKTCENLADMKTDSSINDIFTSEGRVYTASNSGEVRIWRFNQPEIVNLTTSITNN